MVEQYKANRWKQSGNYITINQKSVYIIRVNHSFITVVAYVMDI